MSALLPAIVNSLFAHTQGDGYLDFISLWEIGSRIKTKCTKENMSELTACVLSVQANQWYNRITATEIAEQCVHEASAMLAASTNLTFDDYRQRISAYRNLLNGHVDPRPYLANQLFFLMEPETEGLDAWNARGELIKSGDAPLVMQGTILFALVSDVLRLHEPFIEHVNSAEL
ncbi:MAG: hypothetical protein PF961_16540 [Planctomycetota bacterium]|nr:hypothetical protein [Planctomycetota bacterium]